MTKIKKKNPLKKQTFTQNKKNSYTQMILKLVKSKLRKFEEDCLKTVGGDRFLMKWSFFAFLVCPFHKEPIERSGFNPLYLKNYFKFC